MGLSAAAAIWGSNPGHFAKTIFNFLQAIRDTHGVDYSVKGERQMK